MTGNLADLLARAAARRPDRVALVDAADGSRTTWAELEDAVARCAAGLAAQGLVAGNRVVLATANRSHLVVAYLAALRARLVAVPVNPRCATGELVRIVADSGARLVLADATTADAARAVVGGLRDALATGGGARAAGEPRLVVLDVVPATGEVGFDQLLAAEPAELPAARDPEQLAVLLYTSGTSGRPRAAMLSHRALLANIEQAAAVDPAPVNADDVVLGLLPLFHVYGLNAVLGQVLRQAATYVLLDGFDPRSSLDVVATHGVTVVPVAPPVLRAWSDLPDLRQRLAGVRTVTSGAAPLPPELAREYAERHGVRVEQGYGLTEAGPVVTSTLVPGDGEPDGGEDAADASGTAAGTLLPGSVGRPLPGVRVRVVDERGRDVEGEDPGEILVGGDNLFSGYWPDGSGAPTDGWLATGDVGYLGPGGELVLVDRVSAIIVVRGFTVYPTEVEEVLLEVPGVLEAAAVGVPDADAGEAVHAYVRLAPGTEGPDGPDGPDATTAAEVVARAHALCEERLARFKVPRTIEVVTTLPHTVTGKLARGRLREQARAGAAGASGASAVPGVTGVLE